MNKICCVLIPYYEDAEGLLCALDSIKSKSYCLDVLVVDDGSVRRRATDVVAEASMEHRVTVLSLPSNAGIEHALNAGLEALQDYKYIARLDCGDICVEERFDRQLDYLEAHPDVSLLGSWVQFSDVDHRILFELRQPEHDPMIRKRLYLNATLTHPAIIFRSEILKKTGLYPTAYKAAEDLAFFFNVLRHFKAHNLPEVLVICVVNPAGLSGKYRRKQITSRIRLIIANFDFSFLAFYGLMRSCVMWFIPRHMAVRLRRLMQCEG